MLKNYFKITFRNLFRYKTYSFINITGLAVGIACAVLIMLWVRYELSYDKFNKNSDRLYRVDFTTTQKDYYGSYQPGPLAKYLKDNFPEVEQATVYSEIKNKLSLDTKGFFCTGSIVGPDFFQMFSFHLAEGDPDKILEAPNSIVISKSMAKKIFGQNNPLGKTIKLNDQPGYLVTGVFSDVPQTSSLQFDFVMPFSNTPDWMKMWDRKCVQTFILLKKNASFDDVNNKISGLMDKFNPTWKNVLYLFPLSNVHLHEPGGSGPTIYIYIFSLFGILVLIVACINFMNLSTARSEKRMKEIGIKKAVGSSRMELIKQFLIETLSFSFISLLLAIGLIELFLPYLNSLLGIHIVMDYSITVILILLGITFLTGLISGSYPAIYLSSFNPMLILSNRNSRGEKRSYILRRILVIAQFSFSIFIICCVLLIGKQLSFLQSKNIGFNKNHVLMISTRGTLQQKVSLVKEELLKFPFVQSAAVSATDLTSFEGAGSGPVDWEGKTSDKVIEVGFNFVDEDFAKTFQIKMKEGRFFSKDFTTDMSDAFVINAAAEKAMNLKDPINKKLTTWFGRKGKIVGVISNFNTESLKNEMTPVVFIPTNAANYLCMRISSANIAGEIKSIKNTIKTIVSDDPFEYHFLDKQIDSLYKTEQMTGKLTMFIAILAIFLSCLGLFGLVIFSSEQRTKEIGIRKVLGASILNVLFMLTKDFTKWILIANIIAWPAAYFVMSKWLQGFAYKIDISLWIFILSGVIALTISIFTISFRAIKAATANPVKSLRYE